MATYPPNEPQDDSTPNVDVGGPTGVDPDPTGNPMPVNATVVPATDAFNAARA